MGPRVRPFGFLAALASAGGWFALGAEPPGPPPDPAALAAVLTRQGYHAVPLRRRTNSNYLWLTAGLAGKDVRFVVDTAAGNTALDLAVARRLGLPLVAAGGKSFGLGGSDLARSVTLWPTLTLGGRAAPLPYLLALDLGHINAGQDRDRADRIDGILGADVLDLYSAVVDYTAPALYLLDPAAGHREIQGDWRGVEVEHDGGRYPSHHARQYRLAFDGVKLRFEFDGQATDYRIHLDPHADPKRMTWYAATGATVQAIYEVKGGRLRVAVPLYDGDDRTARPATFTPPKEHGFAVVTLERIPGR